jgi:hypothetical protein
VDGDPGVNPAFKCVQQPHQAACESSRRLRTWSAVGLAAWASRACGPRFWLGSRQSCLLARSSHVNRRSKPDPGKFFQVPQFWFRHLNSDLTTPSRVGLSDYRAGLRGGPQELTEVSMRPALPLGPKLPLGIGLLRCCETVWWPAGVLSLWPKIVSTRPTVGFQSLCGRGSVVGLIFHWSARRPTAGTSCLGVRLCRRVFRSGETALR